MIYLLISNYLLIYRLHSPACTTSLFSVFLYPALYKRVQDYAAELGWEHLDFDFWMTEKRKRICCGFMFSLQILLPKKSG